MSTKNKLIALLKPVCRLRHGLLLAAFLLANVLNFASVNQAMALADCFTDPEYSERYRALLSELRCVKCANQSLLDSPVGVADDLRNKICTQIRDTQMTDDAIKDYFAARYGDYILFSPRGWLWWLMPIIGLLLAVVCVWWFRRSQATPPGMTSTTSMTITPSNKTVIDDDKTQTVDEDDINQLLSINNPNKDSQ